MPDIGAMLNIWAEWRLIMLYVYHMRISLSVMAENVILDTPEKHYFINFDAF